MEFENNGHQNPEKNAAIRKQWHRIPIRSRRMCSIEAKSGADQALRPQNVGFSPFKKDFFVYLFYYSKVSYHHALVNECVHDILDQAWVHSWEKM